jgi:hypothetical protein
VNRVDAHPHGELPYQRPSSEIRFELDWNRMALPNTPHASATALEPRPRARRMRRSLPPLNSRDWMTPGETAVTLGCSIATVHRMRRGLIAGITPLPYSQYGRKVIFRKASTAQWVDENEKNRLT